MTPSFARQYLDEAVRIATALDTEAIERLVTVLYGIRARGGRLFVLGVGGGAAHASHAVNDFRKLAGFEAYAPTDNVSELTARVNDEGWQSVFAAWLKGSRLRRDDGVLVFSVGGGSLEQNISPNLVSALEYARSVGSAILGVVGRDGGFTATVADACVVVPTVNASSVTPHTEAFRRDLASRCLASRPSDRAAEMESTALTARAVFWIETAFSASDSPKRQALSARDGR